MNRALLEQTFDLGGRPPVTKWLRFAQPIEQCYTQETAERRVKELRIAIFLGLFIYNIYNISSIWLVPDIVDLAWILRIGVITPSTLVLVWAIGRISLEWTERLVTIGVFNSYLVPVFLFWMSQDPASLFTYAELPLTIIFANLLLALRFANAAAFTGAAYVVTLLAIGTKSGLGYDLLLTFVLQISTVCLFALFANFRYERMRCENYLRTLSARLEAERATTDGLKFRDQSRTDDLTGLPNRRQLTEILREALSQRRSTAVLMVDVDHFKLYNDALGHPAGDACLQRIADAFARIAAADERAFCARFGGEEFTFVLRDRSEFEAARFARSVQETIEALRMPHPSRGDGLDVVTVSVGVTWGARDLSRDLDEMLVAADRALYEAKRRGRNCFAFDEGGFVPSVASA